MKNKSLKEVTEEWVYINMDQFDKILDKSIYKTNDKIYDEVDRMYKSFIRQFYMYKTKSYIRHGELRPGSREGNQLYYGEDIRRISHGRNPKLIINLPSDIGYTHSMNEPYKFDEPEIVLDYVMKGIRYPYMPTFNNKNWIGSYKGKYFSYTGTLYDAFVEFGNKFNDIAKGIIKTELNARGIKI